MRNPTSAGAVRRVGWLGVGCLAGFLGCSDDSTSQTLPGGGGSSASGGQAGTSASQGGGAGKGAAGRAGASGAAGTAARAGADAVGAGGTSGSGANNGGTSTGGSAGTGRGGRGGSSGASSGSGGKSQAGGGNTSAGEGGEGENGGAAPGGSGGAGGGAGGDSGSELDVFGIRQLYPSKSNGAAWNSAHWDGETYGISARRDSRDPFGLSGMRGTGTLQVNDGELVMSGSQPRIYIYEPDAEPWQNVEVTAYYQRVEDEDTAYAGLVIGVRSGPDGHTDSTACDAHTYYARVRNDGAFDFEKELEHPASSTQSRVQPGTAWPPDGEVPRETWIGFKFVIYNQSANSVKLEAYRDMSNGEDGGSWEKVNETVDDGGWFVETSCAEHSPEGGESDRVVLDGGTTFIRNTDVGEARYRWVSVREISPP